MARRKKQASIKFCIEELHSQWRFHLRFLYYKMEAIVSWSDMA